MIFLMYTISLGIISIYVSSFYISFPQISQNISETLYPINQRIERIRKIEDVIKLLQFLSRRSPTEDVAEKIVNVLTNNKISDETIQILSRLHMKYGTDDGIKGYAINMLWSCIVLYNSSR